VSTDTKVTVSQVVEGASLVIRKRRTDANQWEPVSGTTACMVTGLENAARTQWRHVCTLRGIRVDDWVFGVSSVSSGGFESPVASAVPGGAFKPWVAPVAGEKK